ncbi:chromate efflux transporter [Luteolibacter marinus]|uniref:chromate efflux transporter n=1 Tax=Luteolibacter marinus TaxID=2776705 RepID=UPI001867672B|nr:chromate efflux transporter [Luteolibacter marinus]
MADSTPSRPSFAEAFRFWLKLGLISFGGPTGQIAIMHEELVEKKKWISEERFLHALNYCMLLPGPEAQQLAIYTGWLLHRTWGGIVAGALFVLPSAMLLFLLSWLYMAGQDVEWIGAIFHGLKPAVLAVVAVAVLRIGAKVLKNGVMWGIAALAFVAIFFLKAPFPLIVALAALTGWLGGKFRRDKFLVIPAGGGATAAADLAADAGHLQPSWGRALRVVFTCLALWWLPVLGLGLWLGWDETHAQEGLYFSKAAMVTFGGAYAVLPYVAQQAVERYGWLSTPQMIDGLGMAETTPGPLIMVLQFVGFVAGWQHAPAGWSPLASAALGALVTTWVTFLPCFLWIFLGAPYIERLRGNESVASALSAVTAAVVGVVLNLAVWFAVHALFPAGGSLDLFVAIATVIAFWLMQWRKWQMIPVVGVCAAAGLAYRLLAA